MLHWFMQELHDDVVFEIVSSKTQLLNTIIKTFTNEITHIKIGMRPIDNSVLFKARKDTHQQRDYS